MKKHLSILLIISFALIIFIFFYLLIVEHNPSEIPSALINKKIPNFNSPSLLEKKYFLSKDEFGNETIIVNFFASWCLPCKAEHRYLKNFSENGLKIIGINYKDDPKKAIKWLGELGNPYANVAIDSNGLIAIDWGVYGIPETFIVNANNIIQYRHVGPITKKVYNDIFLKIVENNK